MRKTELKRIIKEIGLVPKKHRGQNFLASEAIAERIVNAASLSEKDCVVEVGPGLGVVTEKILNKGAEVIAIEIDKRLSSYLRKRFLTFKNFHLIEDDFFRLDKKKLLSYKGKKTMKFISNLPYRGAKKIVRKLSRMNTFISIVITLQKEVADVLLVEPGKSASSSLAYFVHYRFKPVKLFDIPLNFFYPMPTVNSSTIFLPTRRPQMKASDEDFFFRTLDLLLKPKRKKLKNNIKSTFNISYNKIEEILEKCSIENNSRPTDLTIEEIINLSNLLKEQILYK